MKALLCISLLSLLAWGLVQDARRGHHDDLLSEGGANDAHVADMIRQAIAKRRMLAIVYDGEERVVEPHMLALNRRDRAVLSAWFLRGVSRSGGGPGWREYLLERITAAYVQDEIFPGSRPGYDASGGRKFHSVITRL